MLENIRDRPRQKFTPSLIKDIECIRLNSQKNYVHFPNYVATPKMGS